MATDKPTRREVLMGMAATSLFPAASLEAEPAASPLCFTSAVEMAQLIRAKKLSAREALAEHLKQIERVNPKVNAIVTLVPEMAAEAAAKADEMQAHNEKLGPLHGLPVAHKDLIETRGIRTTFGSPLFKDYIPTEDDIVVERMRRAGAIIVGKTNTPEFGAGSQTFNTVFGATHNPYDLTKTCGGSSGGAAVALACGMVPVATGSDTGGSLRNPAAFCNVVGFRPSIGRVPNPKAASPGRRSAPPDAWAAPSPTSPSRSAPSPDPIPARRSPSTSPANSSRARSIAASKVCVSPGSKTSAACRSTRASAPSSTRIARPSNRSAASSSRPNPTSLPPKSPSASCAPGTQRRQLRRAAAATPRRLQGHAQGRNRGEA